MQSNTIVSMLLALFLVLPSSARGKTVPATDDPASVKTGSEPGESPSWSGSLSGGGFMTLGNSQSIRINTRANVTHRLINPWSTLKLDGTASYGESMEERYLERIRIEPTMELYLDQRNYCRFGGYWKRDYFAGISRSFAGLLVPGRRLVSTDYVDLTWEMGVLWESRVSTMDQTRTTARLIGAGDIEWDPSEYLTFSAAWETTRDLREWHDWEFSGLMGSENFLAEKVSVFLGYEVQYYSEVPEKLTGHVDMGITLELRISI